MMFGKQAITSVCEDAVQVLPVLSLRDERVRVFCLWSPLSLTFSSSSLHSSSNLVLLMFVALVDQWMNKQSIVDVFHSLFLSMCSPLLFLIFVFFIYSFIYQWIFCNQLFNIFWLLSLFIFWVGFFFNLSLWLMNIFFNYL